MHGKQPGAGRPHMPGYGIPSDTDGLLPWSWAEDRLRDAHNYWIGTVGPDGRPHSMPVWGLWLDCEFWFSTSGTSRKARNLTANGSCTVTTERADEAVIVNGTAREESDVARLEPFVEGYKKKYDWDMDPASGGYFVVAPTVAFGFVEHADQFAKTATRWRFDSR